MRDIEVLIDFGGVALHLPDANGWNTSSHIAEPGSPAEVALTLLRGCGNAEHPRSDELVLVLVAPVGV